MYLIRRLQSGRTASPPRRAHAFLLRCLLLIGGCCSTDVWAQTGTPRPIKVESFSGGTGKSATEMLRKDLAVCGRLRLVDVPNGGVYRIGGSSVGGKIEGKLTDGSGKEIFSRIYAAPSFAENIHMLADDVVYSVTEFSGIAGSIIAFVGEKSGKKEIYMCDYDGGNLVPVTSDGKTNVSPSISPDGLYVVHSGYASGYADIYLIDLGSGEQRRIVNAPGTNMGAAVSPGARQLALTMSFTGNPEIYVTGVGGGTGRRITDTPGMESDPAWSPDGKALVFVSDQGDGPRLVMVDPGGGNPVAVETGFTHCTAPDWSPDGRRIAFNVRVDGKFAIAIFDLKTAKSSLFRRGVKDPCWGPDGRHLAFCEGGSLFIEDLDAPQSKRVRRTVVSGMGRVSEPTWTR